MNEINLTYKDKIDNLVTNLLESVNKSCYPDEKNEPIVSIQSRALHELITTLKECAIASYKKGYVECLNKITSQLNIMTAEDINKEDIINLITDNYLDLQ